jgi:NADP-dependent 3-hydroxy acid dehydrogenase YdfG
VTDDRVLLITGASGGIGAQTARRAVEAGWRVALGARGEGALRELADELGGADRAVVARCDVADWDDLQGFARAALDGFDRIDAVFANAGFGGKRGFLDESPEQWRSMVLTNVLGVALTIRATLPHLLEREAGHYVITGSVAGRRTVPGSLYSATKWAATAIGHSLRAELRQVRENDSIRVTVVEPGAVDTPFFDQRPSVALEADDIARTVMFALTQPEHVDISEILVRPTAQPT